MQLDELGAHSSVSHLPPQYGLEISGKVGGGWGASKAKEFKGKYKEFPEGGGGLRENPFCGVDTDNYFLGLNNNYCISMWEFLQIR